MNSRYLWPAYYLLMAVVAVLVFGDLRHHPLGLDDQATFDDNVAISENPVLLFVSSNEKHLGSGRPIAELFKWLSFLALGNDAGRFHILVAVLHLFASGMVARLTYRLGLRIEVCLIGGFLFLLNVAHFGAVHWISAIDYDLSLILGLSATFLFLRCQAQRSVFALAAFYGVTFAAILTHPAIGMVLPFLLYLSWVRRQGLKRTALILAPILVLALPFLYLGHTQTAEYTTTSSVWRFLEAANIVRVVPQMGHGFLWLLGRMVSTAHFLPFPPHLQPDWEPWLGACLLAILLWILWQRNPNGAPWAAWVLLTVVPFVPASLVHSGISRYLYLATAGSSVLLANGLFNLGSAASKGHPQIGRGLLVAMTAVIVFSSAFALDRAEAVSFYASGRHYFNTGQFSAAGIQLERAIAKDAEVIPSAEARFFLVLSAMASGGDWDQALDQALRAQPEDRHLRTMEAAAKTVQPDPWIRQDGKRVLRAIEESTQEEQGPAFKHLLAIIYDYLGTAAQARGDYVAAAKAFRFSLDHDADRKKSLIGLGVSLNALGRTKAAVQLYEYGIGRRPKDPELHALLGQTHMEAGNTRLARQALEGSVGSGSTEVEVYLMLADLYGQENRRELAIELYTSLMRSNEVGLSQDDRLEISARLEALAGVE